MRFLGVSETCDLGSLYLRLIGEGHDVRVAVSNLLAAGTMAGLVPRTSDWRAELPWIREAGTEGVILFEAVSEGFGALQDQLRAAGFQVIGGSAFGDRLENDRAFGQQLLGDLGAPAGHVWSFDRIADAREWLAVHPGRYVAKFNGSGHGSGQNFIGELADGRDVLAFLTAQVDGGEAGAGLILMEFIEGIEVGVGAYFNGERFLTPACADFEHKRFFAGDMGELTGEMGTVATYSGTEPLFEATLRKIEPLLRGRGHVGYVNLNTIVNERGIWPLEFTCRFGYPGFSVLEPLQAIGWGELFRRMLGRTMKRLPVRAGYSTGVVMTTPPFPYSRDEVDETVGLPIVLDPSLATDDRAHIHLGEVGSVDGGLVTAGLYGWTMVVTGTGATVEASRDAAYRRVTKLTVPRGRYRADIGFRTEDQIEQLVRMGLLTRTAQ